MSAQVKSMIWVGLQFSININLNKHRNLMRIYKIYRQMMGFVSVMLFYILFTVSEDGETVMCSIGNDRAALVPNLRG